MGDYSLTQIISIMATKQIYILLTLIMSMMGFNAYAYDIEAKNADGVTIYYNFIKGDELEVTYHNNNSYVYVGSVVIPEEVYYNNLTRKVKRIGSSAFHRCRSLTSITIPNSVTEIGIGAFEGCI